MPKVKSQSSAKSAKTRAKISKKAKVVAKRPSTASKFDLAAAIKKLVAATNAKQTKSQIIRLLAENSGLTSVQIRNLFEMLQAMVEGHMKKRGSGEFVIPMVGVKIRRIRKKATKKRMGRNPFTGQEIVIPAKPARDVIKVSAMKSLKQVLDN